MSLLSEILKEAEGVPEVNLAHPSAGASQVAHVVLADVLAGLTLAGLQAGVDELNAATFAALSAAVATRQARERAGSK